MVNDLIAIIGYYDLMTIVGSALNAKGEVFVQDYDKGVFLTIGAEVDKTGTVYIIKNMKGVSPELGFEGIPVYFAFSDESIDKKVLPSIIIRRDAITPAMSRWHLGSLAYNVPTPEAHKVTVKHPITGEVIATGYDQYERKDQAVPFDILYTIEIRARFRNNIQVESLKMLQYMMKKLQPYTHFKMIDSEGDVRFYDAFMETPTAVDIMPDIAGKEANFNLTLRVEAELDLNDPFVVKAMTSSPLFNYSIK